MDLIVVEPFENYARGDRITDQTIVSDLLAAGRRGFVTQVASEPAPDPPAPASTED